MITIKHAIFFIVSLLILSCTMLTANAQTEVDKELSSLTGIEPFYAVVNIEAGRSIAESNKLDIGNIQKSVQNKLSEEGINIISNTKSNRRQQYPYLHIHINAMANSTGYIPFSVQANFYQPVSLELNSGKQMMASTWESGSVAIISPDRFDLFETSVMEAVADFISDYNRVN